MSRHDGHTISRKRRTYLARLAKVRAGQWLLSDADSVDPEGVANDEEAEIVLGKIRRIAERLVAAGKVRP